MTHNRKPATCLRCRQPVAVGAGRLIVRMGRYVKTVCPTCDAQLNSSTTSKIIVDNAKPDGVKE